jgi:hypothetical protein
MPCCLNGGNRSNVPDISDQVQFIRGDILDLELMRPVVPGDNDIFSLAGR